ncbi:hypothetical protein H6P81_014899 [Aristolochia fimbriata]|uniref:Association with the SNF1 complex (ASC) domain-containing protein n=1 Tax=Aristolochia fimbriata TaxID=158543 RepID=A0AAV7E5T3_ARIFI|nr:hypothetical protein H6P81_014899 [Aristolochia fimbriata]
MGNVSVKEEGRSSSGIGVEEGQFQHGQAEDDVSYHEHKGLELMGQSPPHSPIATQSPLMFSPQIPMVPLQRPDEPQSPSNSWMQQTDEYEDICSEQGIPTMITWTHGGRHVAVQGSWDNWKAKNPLQKSGKDFTIMKVLPSGVYQYRFLVDGEWRYAPDLPWTHDDFGNPYNMLDLQDFVPDDLESVAGFEPPQSPESSYNNLPLGSDDYGKEPPLVPPHLNFTLLNVPSFVDGPAPLSRPPHVLLNHLYVQRGKSGQATVALGTTHRFLSKYVTVVLYKSLQG